MSSIFLKQLAIDHLLSKQTKKTGLRFVFNEEENANKKEITEFASPSFNSIANGYHLNRSIFDFELLLECKKRGVTVLCPAEMKDVNFNNSNCVLKVSQKGITSTLEATWFIDASGKFRFIKNKFNWVDEKITLNTGVISTHYTHLSPNSYRDREDTSYWKKNAIGPKSYSTTHFLKSSSWWWLIKLDEHTTSVGVVYDKNKIKFSDTELYFNQSISNDKHLSEITKNAKRSKLIHVDSLPHVCTKMHQDNIAVIGDAGAFIDPLFSPGLDLISHQNEYLVSLILNYFKKGKKDAAAWRKYEKEFVKTYLDRAHVYTRLYNFMHSYDLFSNATQLLFFGYQSFTVLPLKYFPKSIKNPLRFHKIDGWFVKMILRRYERIAIRRKNEKRKSTSLKQPVSYSTVRIPNGFYYFIKPIQLMLLWMFNYIKIEATEFLYLIKK